MTYDDGSGVGRETRCHPDYGGLAYRQLSTIMASIVLYGIVNLENAALVQSPIEVRDLPTPVQGPCYQGFEIRLSSLKRHGWL